MEHAKPVSAHDTAAYILSRLGSMTAMKLQKLVFYSQAWSLVWEEGPLFNERVEAWINGPIVPDLYSHHRGEYIIGAWSPGDPKKLEPCQIETIDAVIKFYGDKTAQELSDLTHAEKPWLDARVGLRSDERGNKEISLASMHEYYSGLSKSLAGT